MFKKRGHRNKHNEITFCGIFVRHQYVLYIVPTNMSKLSIGYLSPPSELCYDTIFLFHICIEES